MLVVLAIAALAILACVVLVSLGRGGELTEFPPDVPPLDLPEPGQLTAVDFMALQLPVNLVGYHTQSVDETLRRAATAISARDTRIAVLEQRVSELLSSRLYARQEVYAAPGAGLRTDHQPPAAPRDLSQEGDSAAEPHNLGDQHADPDASSDHHAEPSTDEPEDVAAVPDLRDVVAGPDAVGKPEDDATPSEAPADRTAAFDASAAATEDEPVRDGELVRDGVPVRDGEPVAVQPSDDGEPIAAQPSDKGLEREGEPVRVAPGEDRDESK
ncbi:hypothetical protein ACIBO2_22095 [Nonomuraea sp. NPDC050022]|uniref:hypothetical protein n=1 Tax=unclassified Nonomuraea TaxID=2593643 RepID=UPI0033F480EE